MCQVRTAPSSSRPQADRSQGAEGRGGIQVEPPPGEDAAAKEEDAAIGKERLDEFSRGKEFLRTEGLREDWGRMVRWSLWLLWIAFMGMGLVVFLHFILPEESYWVHDQKLGYMRTTVLLPALVFVWEFIVKRIDK